MSTLPAEALPVRLQRHIFTPLTRLRHRCRLYLVLHGLRWLLIALIGAGLAQLGLDRWLKPAVEQRVLISSIVTLYWLWVLRRRLWTPLTRPLPDRLLAAIVDRGHPQLGDQFATAVQFSGRVGGAAHRLETGATDESAGCGPARLPGNASPELVQAVLIDACRAADGVSFQAVLNHRRAARHTLVVLGLLMLIILAFPLMPGLMGTWFARNWLLHDVAWPQRTHIWPDGFGADGRRRMARGDIVEITASVAGLIPDSAVLSWWTASGRRGRQTMSVMGDARLLGSVGQLSEDIRFHIVGGDERTREYVIEAVERPRVTNLLARIIPPAYTRQDPIVVEQQTVLEVLRGATLEIEARLNKPVQHAQFVRADGVATPCVVIAGGAGETEPFVLAYWPEPVAGSYRFELRDHDGLSNRGPVRYTLKVVPDQPPNVRMELVNVGEIITPRAELPLELLFEDAYGLATVRLLVEVAGRAARSIALPEFSAGIRRFPTELSLSTAAANVVPGDRLRLWAEAEDFNPRGPNVGAASAAVLRVVSADEFLAEMARRELALRQEFERLSATQRKLNDTLDQILPDLPDGARPDAPHAHRLAGLARSQAAQAARCLVIARGFDRILGEMRTSRVARPADEQRIADRIAVPLTRLAQDAIPAAADALTRLRQTVSPETRAAAGQAQSEVLRQMQAILVDMLELEGYREAVALLQEIIDAQTEVRAATLGALERQLEDILELDDALEDADTQPPMP